MIFPDKTVMNFVNLMMLIDIEYIWWILFLALQNTSWRKENTSFLFLEKIVKSKFHWTLILTLLTICGKKDFISTVINFDYFSSNSLFIPLYYWKPSKEGSKNNQNHKFKYLSTHKLFNLIRKGCIGHLHFILRTRNWALRLYNQSKNKMQFFYDLNKHTKYIQLECLKIQYFCMLIKEY